VAAGREQSLAQLALPSVGRDDRVISALICASSVAQLEDDLAALASGSLTDDEPAEIEPLAVERTTQKGVSIPGARCGPVSPASRR
jgi:L-glyceraldehyde 3-phosphate reductase